jgi:hypothetical protein
MERPNPYSVARQDELATALIDDETGESCHTDAFVVRATMTQRRRLA